MSLTPDRMLALAMETLDIEAQAIIGLKAALGDTFVRVIELMLCVRGRVVVMGMGKSGHIARKVAATLASTGTPAMFVHPAEASHGDLGMVKPVDVVLAISNSGEVDELLVILPALKRIGVPIVAMTGKPESTLAKYADFVLHSGVDKEACPLNLAPTASTTAQMALGDAISVVLLEARGFKADDFARSHPGGALGRKLLTLVADVMRTGTAVPRVRADATFAELMQEMSEKRLGAAAVVDEKSHILGIFTDGDLRRAVARGEDLRAKNAGQLMVLSPKTIFADSLAVAAAELMEVHSITMVLVVDHEKHLIAAVSSNDLMRAKVI